VVEVVGGVVRSWSGFRVVLHAEHRALEQAQALDHAVVEVDVADRRRAERRLERLAGPCRDVRPGGRPLRFRGNVWFLRIVRFQAFPFYGEGGEDWFGFKGVRALGDREPDILMIPLPGHTLGHCGIAVRSGDKWLLHAGDAYFFHGQMQASPRMPLVLGMFQRRADMDRAMRIENQERLRTLKANHGDAVTIFNSHDPVDYENCRCGQHQAGPTPG